MDYKALHQRSYFVRKRNAALTALTCAALGGSATYLASFSVLAVIVAAFSFAATVVLTLGVYILYEPASDDLEEFAELMMSQAPENTP